MQEISDNHGLHMAVTRIAFKCSLGKSHKLVREILKTVWKPGFRAIFLQAEFSVCKGILLLYDGFSDGEELPKEET